MGGIDAYRGYEYQIDVSVWCALHLMFEKAICDSIQIEPASQEDIEAGLLVGTENAEAFVTTFSTRHKLVIQVKSRSTGPWNASDIADIVFRNIRSGSNRTAPIERVTTNVHTIYVLITDADVSAELKLFRVGQIGSPSQATSFPTTLRKKLSLQAQESKVASCISLFPRFGWDYCNKKSEEILQTNTNVPTLLAQTCRQDIAEAIRQRLLGNSHSVFTKDELAYIIRRFSGLQDETTSLSYHVMPITQDEARAILSNRHALLIYGEPGVGKSLLAEALVDEHSKMSTPFKVVIERDKPQGVFDAFRAGGPVIAFLDDPWGSTKPGQEAREWCDRILQLLKEVRPDRKIIIVSRHSVIQDIYPQGLPSPLHKIAYKLDKTAYREKERKTMAEKRIQSICRCSLGHQQYFWDNWGDISRHLPYPVEIIAAVDEICENIPANPQQLEHLISRCKHENLIRACAEDLIVRPYHERMTISLSWVLTHTSPNTWSEDGVLFSDWIMSSKVWPNDGLPLSSMINHLVEIGWFKKDEHRGLHIRDPRIERAFSVFLERFPDDMRRIVTLIFSKLLEVGRNFDAFRMIEQLTTRELRPGASMLETLDGWLIENALSCSSGDFLASWRALGQWHVSDQPWAVFARAFNVSQIKDTSSSAERNPLIDFDAPYFSDWTPEQVKEIEKSEKCKALAERLIFELFPGCSEIIHPEKTISQFHEMGWEFPDTCSKAAVDILTDTRQGSPWLLPAFALGLRLWGSNEQLEEMLSLTMDEYGKVLTQHDEWEKEYGDKLGEGVLNAEYEAWLFDQRNDMFKPCDDTLDILVLGLTLRKGLAWLSEAVNKDLLFGSCCRALGDMREHFSDEEIDRTWNLFFSLAKEPWHRREVWRAAGKAGLGRRLPDLIMALGADEVDEVKGALEGISKMCDPCKFGDIVGKRSRQLNFVGKCRLVQALINFDGPIEHVSNDEYQRRATVEFTEVEQFLLDSLPRSDEMFSSIRKKWEGLNQLCRDYVIDLAKAGDIAKSFYALTLASCGRDGRVLPLTKDWALCWDKGHKFLKLQALLQFPHERGHALATAMEDKHYKCRRLAVEILAGEADKNEILKQRIIKLANTDPSGPVREACIRIIGQYQWCDGLPALLAALEDKRDVYEGDYIRQLPNHHVARVAATQLDDFLVNDVSLVPPLLDFLKAGSQIQSDVLVHCNVILALRHYNSNTAVASALSELLIDDWYVHALKNSGHIRRVAAALALVGTTEQCIIQDVKAKIDESDDRVAGPALIILGSFGDVGLAHVSRVLEMDEDAVSRGRKVLTLAILMLFGGQVSKEKLKPFEEDTIARLLIVLCEHLSAIGKVPLKKWTRVHPFLKDLSRVLRESGHLGPSLFIVLRQLLGPELEDVCSLDELTNDTMPENIKTISIRYFLGCE